METCPTSGGTFTNKSEKNQAIIISFSEVSIQATHCINICGPSPRQGPMCGRWGLRHRGTSRCQTPTSAHPCFRAGNGGADPARSQPRHSPASVRGPWSRHRLENPTPKDLFARPGAQPSARRPPAACGGSVITGP